MRRLGGAIDLASLSCLVSLSHVRGRAPVRGDPVLWRAAFCSTSFPSPLGQVSSLHALRHRVAVLFGRFVGAMGRSDFPLSSIIGVWPLAFPMRPALPAQVTWGSPGSRAERFCTCGGS